MAAQMQIVEACAVLNTPLGDYKGSAEEKMETEELECMLPLTREIGSFEQQEYTVDKYGTIVVQKVHYSVPDHLVGKKVVALLYSNTIKVCYQGKQVCEHERTPLNGWKLDIMHYLRTLSRKPGAVAGSVALYMLRDDLKLMFETHFTECPADFVILLQKAKDTDTDLDAIVEAEKKIRRKKMRVTLDAFNHVLFGEESGHAAEAGSIGISSKAIEKQACDTLKSVMQIMNSNANTYNTNYYGAEA